VLSSLTASFYFLALGEVFIEWEVLSVGRGSVLFVLIFDFMSMLFIFTVRLVSCGVIIFRGSYIAGEKFFGRFILLVIRFIISMFLLILSPNLISILLGWDGLGVTSYLLVIYYQRSKSYNAGIITALTNRIGDVGILIRISLLLSSGDWRFTRAGNRNLPPIGIVILIIIVARMTKSAQMPFSAWLPAAIAAPTPVSALVHSSTLVTAGVYLLIRHRFLIRQVLYLHYLLLIGSMTMLMAGVRAMQELDIKKVVALSTLRQLGLMIIIIGAGIPLLGFLHLLSHAYFKAILFMCAGMLIHRIKDYQDIRTMGFGSIALPLTMGIFTVANLSLCGMPFIAGFYSKDLILEMVLMRPRNIFMFFVAMLATFLTVAYTCRLRFLTSAGLIKREGAYSLLDKDVKIARGIMVLLLPTLLGGNFLCWCLFSFNKSIILPASLKLLVPVLIVSSAYLNLSSYIGDKLMRVSSMTVWATSNMLFIPLTFSVLSRRLGLECSKTITRVNDLA
jgi:NADH-ubiquinone oxidoreductase chain 5